MTTHAFPGPFLNLPICSLYLASSPSSLRILTSIEDIRASVWKRIYNYNILKSKCELTELIASWRDGLGFLVAELPKRRFIVRWDVDVQVKAERSQKGCRLSTANNSIRSQSVYQAKGPVSLVTGSDPSLVVRYSPRFSPDKVASGLHLRPGPAGQKS